MAELVEGGFLNEERFARTFARGKFRIKQWGKIRITQELKRRQISAYCIKKALEEIETEAYHATLRELLQKKEAQLQADLPPQRRIKLLRYALQKGYEPELIYNVLGE